MSQLPAPPASSSEAALLSKAKTDALRAFNSPSFSWNKGVFANELQRIQRAKPKPDVHLPGDILSAPQENKPIGEQHPTEGTYYGTKNALSEIYERIVTRYENYHDMAGFDESIPTLRSVEQKQNKYRFQPPNSDGFPPHLLQIPPDQEVPLDVIFSALRLADVGTIIAKVIPESILDYIHGDPGDGTTIAQIETRNRDLHQEGADIYELPNVGDREEWWTDQCFAQQHLTGTNPCTLELATPVWVQRFTEAANAQGNAQMLAQLSAAQTKGGLYMQDYSYFREAVGLAADAIITSGTPAHFWSDSQRWGCAPVALFNLEDSGALHPLAVILDYRGSMEHSVTTFNRRTSSAQSDPENAQDWAWRFAKTCVQSADWLRHEATVHLTETHLIEEVVIVAANRAFDTDHIVYELLYPHWLKTLPLNEAARQTLVPSVIVPLTAFPSELVGRFVCDAYKRFNWQARYVPQDLATRGFPPDQLNTPKFHNAGYARNIVLMWQIIEKFVTAVLAEHYPNDAAVVADTQIAAWCNEMRSTDGGQMDTFPQITTKAQLVEAVTMCIHLASPQHSAVNYLQDFYQSFVINKPPAFFAPIPETLEALQALTEDNFVKLLPINQPRYWLIASHVSHLLSLRVADNQNLPNYALSVYKLALHRQDQPFADAALKLYSDLEEFGQIAKHYSDQLDDKGIPYMVLAPDVTAVSILI